MSRKLWGNSMQAVAAGSENAVLVGDLDGRDRLATPALIVDLDALEGNLAAVAERCRASGVALRPHVKGHKCVELGRRQLASGAIGLSCTTLAEAELMVTAGAESLLITSPVIGRVRTSRLSALASRVADIIVAVDDYESLAPLAGIRTASGQLLRILVDLDVGQRRTGVPVDNIDDVASLAGATAASPGLSFAGLQAYYGHLQAIPLFAERAEKARAAQAQIALCVARLAANGLAPQIVSGGGTGTLLVDTVSAPFTEVQPGSYPFLDAQYQREELTPDGTSILRGSLLVRGRVVSASQRDRVTIDIGMKAASTDGGPPLLVAPADVDAEYVFAGDEHGFLLIAEGSRRPRLGESVELIPSHCDTTTNLHAAIHAVRGQKLEAIWPIGARGVW